MKIIAAHEARKRQAGYALFLVMIFTGLGCYILATMLSYATTNNLLIARNNQSYVSEQAAEAATEKILTRIEYDFVNGGEGQVYSHISTYQGLVPTSSEMAYWSQFQFSDAQGNLNQSYVSRLFPAVYTNLNSQYVGLWGLAATYRVISNARMLNQPYDISVGVKQDVDVATIPAFQFAIFYNVSMEINPGPVMNVTGRVHSNTNLYAQPQAPLTFYGDVTAVGSIQPGIKSPLDPTSRTVSTVTFNGAHDSAVTTLALPIGTNNTPSAVQAIIYPPPAGESTTSPMGQMRYYNEANLIILASNLVNSSSSYTTNHGVVTTNTTYTTNTQLYVTSGLTNNFATTVPASQYNTFISTSNSFSNAREGKTIDSIDLDIGALGTWSKTNASVGPVEIIYVGDYRTTTSTSSTEQGIRVKDGQYLTNFPAGLTVATPDPLYVWGNYNVPTANLGTTNTSQSKPASFAADAIMILSPAWTDANSTAALTSRNATATTVNAAFLTGNVPSNGTYYSGGVENFPRFLENWSGITFTYNGSMVCMFTSAFATAPWGGSNVYNPPNRNWAFDLNYENATTLPPGTPSFRAMIRGVWSAVAPNNVN